MFDYDFPVPLSLQEWAMLNLEMDQLEEEGQFIRAEELYPRIEDAWDAAPFFDRSRVSWELLKKVWRERHEDR